MAIQAKQHTSRDNPAVAGNIPSEVDNCVVMGLVVLAAFTKLETLASVGGLLKSGWSYVKKKKEGEGGSHCL